MHAGKSIRSVVVYDGARSPRATAAQAGAVA